MGIQSSQMIYVIILLSFIFLFTLWLYTFISLRRLKNIKFNENQLEELLYYRMVDEIHEIVSETKPIPETIRKIQLDRNAFIHELKNALDNNQFILHYQPIVNSNTGKIIDIEALIRWQHPVHGLLFPDSFLSLCENTGFIIPLGEWIFLTACKQLKAWREMGFAKLGISINLSALQLNDSQLLPIIEKCLSANDLPAEFLKIEITENSIMNNMEKSIQILHSLSELGLKLSLDDFGTGYSSLQYLKQLPIENLKIDKMFLNDMTTDITSFGIIESIIALGKSLGITVTAEGVENNNQLHILSKMGCDFLQGYLYSKPVPSDEFTKILCEQKNSDAEIIHDYANHTDSLRFDVLTDEYYDQAVSVITQAFCENEPMTKYLGITPIEFIPFAKIIIEKAIHDELSMVAIDDDKVIACTIVEDIAEPLNINIDIDARFRIIFSLLETLGSEFFSERAMYKGHIAHLFVTAVDKNYHGQGLSRKINFESIKLAKERNFDFMCCEFTHNYSEKATLHHLKNNKLLIRSCKYKDFIFDGIKPFENLDGYANAYIWELREGAKLRYKIHQD